MRITAPDLQSRRARFADWLEISCLASFSGEISLSTIKSLIRRVSDDRLSATDLDIEADGEGEQEITERVTEDLEERITEELELRVRQIGNAYPFILESSGSFGFSQVLKRKASWKTEISGELIYTFCLLNSAIRDGLLTVPGDKRKLTDQIGNVFQICSCIAVGGYTRAEVVSFGFPRATGDGFLPALQAAWSRYGSYKVHDEVPYGSDTRLKDGGVDIIAWQSFADGHAATFLMFVQVASGMEWKKKSVTDDVKTIRQWFRDERFEHFTPAICIPFPLWYDLDDPPKSQSGKSIVYIDGLKRKFAVRENGFGVIFDRGRIALSAAAALSNKDEAKRIDGRDRLDEVLCWVMNVMAEVSEQRSVT